MGGRKGIKRAAPRSKVPRHDGAGVEALVITAGGATVAAADGASVSRNAGKSHSAKQRGEIRASQIAIQLELRRLRRLRHRRRHAGEARRGPAPTSEIGYRKVEPFTFNGYTAAQFKALLDKYHLKARSRHGDVSITNFATTLADSKTLGQKYVGSGGFPTPGIGGATRTRWRRRSS